jgi:DNA repair protein RadC
MTNAELVGVASGRDPRTIELLLSEGISAGAKRAVGEVRRSIELVLELARRVNGDSVLREVVRVRSALDVVQSVEHRLRGLDQEGLWVVVLSLRNHILGMDRPTGGV